VLGLRVVEPIGTRPPARAWGVAALLLAIAEALAARFASVTVEGEISGFSRAASGHCYFTLKDADGAAASLRCAMFRRAATLLDFAPRDGARVEVRGRLSVFEPRGEMQLVVESMRAVGAGSLYEQFLRLKAKLDAEGLFAASRKRKLPAFPARVGVVTSLAGAALHDVLTTLARRAPQVAVIVYPSLVQGTEAPSALVDALRLAAQRNEVDVLLVVRGGGSIEDLWAFNDETVVRAIAAMPMPTLSGVGHETDVTLADFVADQRAATPTAAAELAAPARDDAMAALAALGERQRARVRRRLEMESQRLDQRAQRWARPSQVIAQSTRRLDAQAERLRRAIAQRLERARERPQRLGARLQAAAQQRRSAWRSTWSALQGRLQGLDPHRVLARGYAWVTDDAGAPVTSARAVHAGQRLVAVWYDGEVTVRAEPGPSTPRG
jgi:exodeoxyribonuclease VII large subunit